jgi:hypothetical protein
MQEIMDSMNRQQAADSAQKEGDAAKKHAEAKQVAQGGGNQLGGTPGPVVYPGLPPKPALSPAGRVVGGPQA